MPIPSQRHRIRRQVLEVTTRDRTTAEALQPELARIHRRRIAALLDRCLSEVSAPDSVLRIERLELDLGVLDPDHLERDFVERLGERLRRALAAHRLEDDAQRGPTERGPTELPPPGARAALELLDVFVRTGRLPWWADATQPRVVAESLERLSVEAPALVAGWLRDLTTPDRRAAASLQRLVRHTDDDRLTTLCEALVPVSIGTAPGAPPGVLREELSALLAARRAMHGTAPQRYRDAVWQAVLQVLGVESLTPRGFWPAVATRVASRLGVTLAALTAGLREVRAASSGRTAEVLDRLVGRLEPARIPEGRLGEAGARTPAQELELVDLFVRTGRLPAWADTSRNRLLAESLERLLAAAPDHLADWLRSLAREGAAPKSPARDPGTHAAWRRLVRHVDAEQLEALGGVLAVREPIAAVLEGAGLSDAGLTAPPVLPGVTPQRFRDAAVGAILRVAAGGLETSQAGGFWPAVRRRVAADLGVRRAALTEAWRQVFGPPNGDAGPAAAPHSRPLLADGGNEPGDARQRGRRPAPGIEPSPMSDPDDQGQPPAHPVSTAHPGTKDPGTAAHTGTPLSHSTFSETETAYVDNAGLVILWPFLGHFFDHAGLMTAQVFHDRPAVHRAVGLLQHVVTEDPTPPEYQLTLNKVLCGLGVDEALDLEEPISEAETEECSSFLSAVIAQAPILGEMSHAGFRGTFLLRPGTLEADGETWLLRVERQAYDVVLERFPWTWSWVKLAWMEAPLRVEW